MITEKQIMNIIKNKAELISGVIVTDEDRKLAKILRSHYVNEKPEIWQKIYKELSSISFEHASLEASAVLLAMHRKREVKP